MFQHIWKPVIGEELDLEHEEDNPEDKNAIAVKKSGLLVGHAPREHAKVLRFYMQRGGSILAKVTGKPINRALGHGVEVPCELSFHSPRNSDTKALAKLLC